jgi:hypothetical protein
MGLVLLFKRAKHRLSAREGALCLRDLAVFGKYGALKDQRPYKVGGSIRALRCSVKHRSTYFLY